MVGHLDGFDDRALRVFLQPGEAGVDPHALGLAIQGEAPALVERVHKALSPAARRRLERGLRAAAGSAELESARRAVVERLFWPLLYWHDPAGYEELVAGELIHPRLLEMVAVDGLKVCDVGAGAGRFTFHAAARAATVIAVDEVPPLLRRLERRLRESGVDNVEVSRGSFTDLPLADHSVDVAVACSSVTSREPFGGQAAIDEMERVVRPGGQLAVIWPDRPEWFRERGFLVLAAEGNRSVSFADPQAAERICRRYYSEEAARWVAANRSSQVPYAVLGVDPPNHACLREVDSKPGDDTAEKSLPRTQTR